MPEWLKKLFRQRTPLEIATTELDDAKRKLLEAESGKDYAIRIVEYHKDRITRLTQYITNESRDAQNPSFSKYLDVTTRTGFMRTPEDK